MTASTALVLCVDDDAAVLEVTRKLLESAGYRVLSASSGAEALRITDGSAIDAAVLDYSMPGMNGGELAARLRELHPQLPIIFYTGSSDRLGQSGAFIADACVEKGGSVMALLEVVAALLDRTPRRKYVRHIVVAPLAVRIHRPGHAAMLPGRSFDLSEGGIGGQIDGALLPGQVVSLTLQLPNRTRQIDAAARVAYANGDRHGFQFLALPQPDRELIRATLIRMN